MDPRGLPVRAVAYYRDQRGKDIEARVARTTYDAAGRLDRQWDPRAWQAHGNDPSGKANQRTIHSLSGLVVRSESVDAGSHVKLYGDAGQLLMHWDSRGNSIRTDYDEALRPKAIYETMQDGEEHCVERFSYGDVDSEAAAHNRCGRLVRHDDAAGTQQFAEYGVQGDVLDERCRFLANLELPNWPEALPERDALLEAGEGHATQRSYGALGDLLGQTDAKGNTQRHAYSVAGQRISTTLQQAAQTAEQVLVSDIAYNAFEQIQAQTAGNGVHTEYTYDPADGRLCRLTARRSDRTLLQDQTYAYDPVRHFRNQRVQPVSTYAYDTLYQLTEATGYESASGLSDGPGLPEWLPLGDEQWENYHEWYRYDAGGNLIERRHQGAWNNTRTMAVAAHSNRALPKREGAGDPGIEAGFDANGNQQELEPGQAMVWDTRNQLVRVVQVSREEGTDDAEIYRYDGDGRRVRKLCTRQAKLVLHTAEVRYLPGLELHTDMAGETLEVITVNAGNADVRVLHWVSGKPGEIENNQLRYAFGDHLGSNTLELDRTAAVISREGYYPYGGTAWRAGRSAIEASYRTVRYSGKERDATGLYYYGFRYYAPWLQRWINPDPAGEIDGLNLFCFVRNNPVIHIDFSGLVVINASAAAASGNQPATSGNQPIASLSTRPLYRAPRESRLFERIVTPALEREEQQATGSRGSYEPQTREERFAFGKMLFDQVQEAGGDKFYIGRMGLQRDRLLMNPRKGPRVLNSPKWSMGLNDAFIYGAVNAIARAQLWNTLTATEETMLRQANAKKTNLDFSNVMPKAKDPLKKSVLFPNRTLRSIYMHIKRVKGAGVASASSERMPRKL